MWINEVYIFILLSLRHIKNSASLNIPVCVGENICTCFCVVCKLHNHRVCEASAFVDTNKSLANNSTNLHSYHQQCGSRLSLIFANNSIPSFIHCYREQCFSHALAFLRWAIKPNVFIILKCILNTECNFLWSNCTSVYIGLNINNAKWKKSLISETYRRK